MSGDDFAPALGTGTEEYAEKAEAWSDEHGHDCALHTCWRTEKAAAPVSGMCTHCGAIEVTLVKATGVRDFSAIGESSQYPTGYGCELCS